MERNKIDKQPKGSPGAQERSGIYDLETPRWSSYYQKMRKNIRFPRYYKKALNW